jgi:hypothetical protein
MITHRKPTVRAETAALRVRQRQIGRELRLYYQRLLRDPLPTDMIDALREAEESRPKLPAIGNDPPSSR